MSASKGKKFSTDELRTFYFSKATNFSAFGKSSESVQRSRNDTVSPSQIDVVTEKNSPALRTLPSTLSAATPLSSETNVSPVAAAITDVEPPSSSKKQIEGQKRISAGSAVAVAKASNTNGDSVSPAYILFLRQQQDLVKSHCAIDEIMQKFLDLSTDRCAAHFDGVSQAETLLREAEASTEWNWKSKFAEDALAQDAGLTVPKAELKNAEDIPKVVEMQYQQQQLVKLKQAHCQDKNFQSSDFKLVLENGIRRLERLIKEYSASQLDAGPVVRISDNLLVQLDHVLAQPPLEKILRDINDSIGALSMKQQECMSIRDTAHDDGEMDVAERETYRLVDLSEELSDAQLEKIRLLQKALEENTVSSSVRDNYSKKALEDSEAIEANAADLKVRCESDLARLYQLKKQVEEAETAMIHRTKTERGSSDERLDTIAKRQKECWDQIAFLIKQVRQLEGERFAEVKHRIEEKVKDETRKNEFVSFCNVANAKAIKYDRTIKNCDTSIHCCKLMSEFLQSGFFTIQKSLAARNDAISEALLEAQKCHLEVFRSLLFTLGDLEYKKERRIEELNQNIQAAHIQQEMCNDSLNPNAKKFSDAKKELLRIRDELELEIRDIRDRQNVGLQKYNSTEVALGQAGHPHTHPMADLDERRLNTRAKMVEYKAMALGHVSSLPLKSELESLKQSLNESRRIISRSSTKPLPITQ